MCDEVDTKTVETLEVAHTITVKLKNGETETVRVAVDGLYELEETEREVSLLLSELIQKVMTLLMLVKFLKV